MTKSPQTRRSFKRVPSFLRSWTMPALVLICGVLASASILGGFLGVTTRPSQDFLFIVLSMEALLAGWIVFLSPLDPQQRLIGIVTFVSVQAGLFQLVRLDGFMGDGRPIWTSTWTPPPAKLSESDGRDGTLSLATQSVDLTKTSKVDFPGFRGVDRTGLAVLSGQLSSWNTKPPRLLWRQPVGAGWSSFAVVGDHCVTQEQRGADEATVCYELRTGRECWVHRERARFSESTSGDGPRATPTIHSGRVYSLGATGILNCLGGTNGLPIWTVNILQDNSTANRLFGVTGSPLVVGNLVIVNPGGVGSSLAAYDANTGSQVWQAGMAGASYSSPQYANLCRVDQVLDFNADGLFAHELSSGDILWSVPWISNPAERNNVCQPAVWQAPNGSADQVFIASGYGMGCALLELQKQNKQFTVKQRWHNRNLKAKFSSVVVKDGFAYGFDHAVLTCVDLSSGERRWKGGHYGYGQLILAGSLLLVQLESGEVAMVEASTNSFREIARFDALAYRTWNHPALAGPYFVVRNDREAACYELSLNDCPNALAE